MGWLSKIFKGCKQEGQSHKYIGDDESSNNEFESTSEDGSVDCDMGGETDRTAYHSPPSDGCRWNDVTDHHHHNYINDSYNEAHSWGYDYEGQCKNARYSMEGQHLSLTSQQHYYIDSPYDSGNTFQLDPLFSPSYSLLPVFPPHINYALPHSTAVWSPEECHHSHESYFPNTSDKELQDRLISENSTSPALRCYICKNLLQTGVDGRLQFRQHPFWQQKYCPSHKLDGTPKCFSCRRLMGRDSNPLSLNDGRKVCSDCQSTSIIMTIQDCQPLVEEIQQFYEKLEMKVEQHFPIHLVDMTDMNERNENRATFCSGTTIGKTLARPSFIRIAVNTPKIRQAGEILKIDKKQMKLVGNQKVIAIRVLHGLPRLHTGSTLAHEMMHAWLCQEGYHVDMDYEVYEGTCEIMSYIWLQSKIDSITKSSFERKLCKFYIYSIEKRKGDAYGDGFQRGKKLLDRYGLKETLEIVRFTGGFLDDFTR